MVAEIGYQDIQCIHSFFDEEKVWVLFTKRQEGQLPQEKYFAAAPIYTHVERKDILLRSEEESQVGSHDFDLISRFFGSQYMGSYDNLFCFESINKNRMERCQRCGSFSPRLLSCCHCVDEENMPKEEEERGCNKDLTYCFASWDTKQYGAVEYALRVVADPGRSYSKRGSHPSHISRYGMLLCAA